MIKRIEIWDLDGCVIDSSHRYSTIIKDGKEVINLPYWRENSVPEKIAQDTLLPMAKVYRQSLEDKDCFVIVATARVCQQADIDYVNNILGKPDYFICRKEGDNTSGGLLKEKGIRKLLNLKQFKDAELHVFEDNHSYLKHLCMAFNCLGTFIPSKQGH